MRRSVWFTAASTFFHPLHFLFLFIRALLHCSSNLLGAWSHLHTRRHSLLNVCCCFTSLRPNMAARSDVSSPWRSRRRRKRSKWTSDQWKFHSATWMNATIFRSTTQIGRRETCKSNKRKGNNHSVLAKLRSLLGSDIRVVTLNSNGPTSRWRWWTRRRHKRQGKKKTKQKGKTSHLVFFALLERICRKFGIPFFGDRKVHFVQLDDFDSFD